RLAARRLVARRDERDAADLEPVRGAEERHERGVAGDRRGDATLVEQYAGDARAARGHAHTETTRAGADHRDPPPLRLTAPHCRAALHASLASSAWLRSAIRSSASSTPTAMRTKPSSMPSRSRASRSSPTCDVYRGIDTSVSTPPRLG